jgi:putative oxidoreductase
MSHASTGPFHQPADSRPAADPAAPPVRPSGQGFWHALLGGERTEPLERYGALIGRLLICHIFLLSGITKVVNWSGTEEAMARHGMFAVPLFLVGAIAFELGGGLSLLLGYRARLGALALLLFLIPTTLVFHNFWAAVDPKEHQEQLINFMKNVALMGGLAMVISFGPGLLSLDHRREAGS